MLYPKEDKERRILLYAVSIHYNMLVCTLCYCFIMSCNPNKDVSCLIVYMWLLIFNKDYDIKVT